MARPTRSGPGVDVVETAAGYVVLDHGRLAGSELEGYQLGGAAASIIFIDLEPGGGPRLHRHPYEEVFIVLEGLATFTVGADVREASAGKVLVVQAGVPHKFVNSGQGRLRQVDIHLSATFVTDWLEDELGRPLQTVTRRPKRFEARNTGR